MVQIYDTTLRDGTQRKDISLSSEDKIRIAYKLDELGVSFIEGGWPGSNPKDAEFFEKAASINWTHAVICAFGSTCRANVEPKDDVNIQALLSAKTPVCTLVGKSSKFHVHEVLRTTLEENLRIIEESVSFLCKNGRRVVYDAEHFFDGFIEDADYTLQTLMAAARGGAETLVLADTNGGTLPWKIQEITRKVKSNVDKPLGIHAHNDSGMAVANSLAAFQEGCIQIQGTFNGFGERCGNADLCSIIPTLELKMGEQCLPEGNLPKLYEASHFISEVANLSTDEYLPYVGKSAFAHKGGIHVAAMRRNPKSYQHIDPALVGNKMRIIVSELSGKGNLLSKAEEYGVKIDSGLDISNVLEEIKLLESQGFSFEAAEASVILLINRQKQDYRPPFELIDFSAIVEQRQGRGIFAEATVKVKVSGEVMHTAAEGNGPVNALDAALRKALLPHYPVISTFHLADYKVRILNGDSGTGAKTRVLIDTHSSKDRWSTVGASENIIEASWRALADSFEYGLSLLSSTNS